jgi:hypothetical protein
MEEPPAIKLQDVQIPGRTLAKLNVEVRAAEGNRDKESMDQLPQTLQNLVFKVETILRVKTFYSVTPFARNPGQALLTLSGPVRL